MQAAEARLAELGYHLCPHCDYEVEKDYLRCPSCMRKLKDPCKACGKPLDPSWKVCPYCEAEIGSAAPTARRTRRRRESASDQPVAGPDTVGEPRGTPAPTRYSERGGAGAPVERGGPSATRGTPAPTGFSERGGAGAPVERGGPSAT
jgi:hypothetical protein